ncbi:MAG: NAD(P)-dependent oxidoreductase [Candidatus Pacebacteria bacterium]|nr:NAD(P)-dependent oxidoreductase [Candidatus Paceibacterota bacterium]
MTKKIAAFFDISIEEKKYLENKLKDSQKVSPVFYRSKLNKRTVGNIKDAEIVVSFVYSRINQDVLKEMSRLKLISTMSTGFDHIDLEYCKEKGITVCNIPAYGERTVAEHTFALILSLSRKIPQSIEKTRKFDFSLEGLRGFDLENKTLGLVGTGHIGANVAKIAKGFEMNIIASEPKPDKALIKKLGIKIVSLENLLQSSDIISLHAPLNRFTYHLINKKNIMMIKKGAYIINTARGGLIETEALIKALDRGILSGAGIDVLEEESAIKEEKELLGKTRGDNEKLKAILQNRILSSNPRVIITPHNAFNSNEAMQRILDTTIENIENFLKGTPMNIID